MWVKLKINVFHNYQKEWVGPAFLIYHPAVRAKDPGSPYSQVYNKCRKEMGRSQSSNQLNALCSTTDPGWRWGGGREPEVIGDVENLPGNVHDACIVYNLTVLL